MSFIDVLELCLRIINVMVSKKEKKEKLELQLYEFARKFSKNAVDENSKHRQEYKRLRQQLKKERKTRED